MENASLILELAPFPPTSSKEDRKKIASTGECGRDQKHFLKRNFKGLFLNLDIKVRFLKSDSVYGIIIKLFVIFMVQASRQNLNNL